MVQENGQRSSNCVPIVLGKKLKILLFESHIPIIYHHQAMNNLQQSTFNSLIKNNKADKLNQFLIKMHNLNINLNNQMIGNYTILTLAAQYGHIDCIRALVSHGIDIDGLNESGSTTLGYLCWYFRILQSDDDVNKNVEIIKYLIESGANCNIQGYELNTALIYMCNFNGIDVETRIETVKLLLDHGADRDLINEYGQTAESFARGNGFDYIADIVRDYVPDEVPETKGVCDG